MAQLSAKSSHLGQRVGFVPTMGALHAGHLSLMHKARQENDLVVVSIFVNPLQFAPQEDFKQYPRNLKQDILLCRQSGVDIIFSPQVQSMYPDGYKTYVEVSCLSDVLCGRSRPGHFKAVATVVTKLFNIVRPDIAYFGQKDAQQAVIVRKLVKDLNLPLKIRVMPTVREKNGLALSSRNLYLGPGERKSGRVLNAALRLAKKLIAGGIRDSGQIIQEMRTLINKEKNVKIDYLAVVDRDSLLPLKKISGSVLIALAVYLGKTRLIDNAVVRTFKKCSG
jgi:pantoate--beta-alanine ligase